MTAHIDTLKEWWSEAEEGVIEKGDTVINWFGGETTVYVAAERARRQNPHTRILARAPKRKPAWHDAIAVIAHTARFSERRPFALTHTEDVLDPYNTEWITRDDLIDPVPLIEAKVTDAARDRVWEELVHHGLIDPQKHRPSQGWTADVVHVALGLETA